MVAPIAWSVMKYKTTFVLVPAASVVLIGLWWILSSIHRDEWPPLDIPITAKAAVAREIQSWKTKKTSYRHQIQEFRPFNDYLNYGTSNQCAEKAGRIKLDDRSVFLQYNQLAGKYTFNAVLAAQCGLKALGAGNYELATAQIEGLMASQNLVGGFADTGPYFSPYLGATIEPGSVSGMSQGQALSLFARAFRLNPSPEILAAGARAVGIMKLPVSEGGVMGDLRYLDPSLSGYITFEETTIVPHTYILNGFMFALLGLYDWSHLPEAENKGKEEANELYWKGILTLENILPYYDMEGLSAYDLGYITYKAKPRVSSIYHSVHVALLHALYSTTENTTLKQYRDKWQSDIDAIERSAVLEKSPK